MLRLCKQLCFFITKRVSLNICTITTLMLNTNDVIARECNSSYCWPVNSSNPCNIPNVIRNSQKWLINSYIVNQVIGCISKLLLLEEWSGTILNILNNVLWDNSVLKELSDVFPFREQFHWMLFMRFFFG